MKNEIKKKREDNRSRITFSPTEYADLKFKAAQSNRTVKDYVLDCTIGPKFVATDSRAYMELHEEIQSLKEMNWMILFCFKGRVEYIPTDFRDVMDKMDKIIELEKKIYHRIKKQGGAEK